MIEFTVIEFVMVLVVAMAFGLVCGYYFWK